MIRKSSSPWASPVVIVGKKGGELRLCVDYRKLNALTKPDMYPLPRIDDMLESFSGASWFTTLDLASGYWQIAMDPKDIEKTAFITPFGLYEFLVMPFGLAYAPGTFQRLMNNILHDYLGRFVAVYLDDIIIYSKGTFENHIGHLKQVFETLRRANLKIKLKKCYFCLPNIHFLGHIVGQDGIKPDPEKIEKIKNFPEPRNVSQLRSALGLFSYYRRFIKDFSKIARPLNTLLKKEEKYLWTNKQQRAFDFLKERLISAPILTYPNFEKPFTLYTDASGTGLGAVLTQLGDDNKEHVISYASRSLNSAETNYPITDQECLAVVWAIKYYQHYLELQPFTVVTDHSALKWLQTSKLPKGRRARWIMDLQQFKFTIKHRPGKQNANADALSRMYDEQEQEQLEVSTCYMMETQFLPWSEDDDDTEDDADDESNNKWERQRPLSSKQKGKQPANENINQIEWEFHSDEDSRNPTVWACCGKTNCTCYEPVSEPDEVDEEDTTNIPYNNPGQNNPLYIPDYYIYKPTIEEMLDIYRANLVHKQVIANQPI